MLVGHQKQWQFLKKTLELNRLSHAYLLSGPESLGKKTLAIEFIKLINCQKDGIKKKPCGECSNCKMIQKNGFADLSIIGPKIESEGENSIQISQIRELQKFLSFRPYYDEWKSVVLDEAEKMTQEAQSCLLKTLEEVKGKVLLFLISSHPELLLPTIYSRCQTIKFLPVNNSEIKKYILSQGISEKKAEMLTDISQGRPGRVIDFILNPEKLEKEIKILKEISETFNSDLASRFNYLKNVTINKEFLEALQKLFRYNLLLKTGVKELSGLGYFPEPSEKLKSSSVSKIKKIIKLIDNINFLIFSTNVNPKLALELLFLEI